MARRIFFSVILFVFVIGLFINPAPASAKKTAVEVTRDTLYVPGEVVVGFEQNLAAAAVQTKASALANEVSAMVVDVMPGAALLSFAEDADVPALVAELAGKPGVAYTEPNYISWIPEENPVGDMFVLQEVERTGRDGQKVMISVAELKSMRRVVKSGGKTMGIPTYANDTWNNWGFDWINAEIIWPNTASSPTVCVLDTGVDGGHPDLAGKVVNGKDFVNNDSIPNDDNGHGTHVSGVIAAKNNNGQGPAGISNGKVLAVKVLSAQGWGTDFDISKGIIYCADNTSVKVINMSLGGPSSSNEYNALYYAIVTKGKLVVAAAGNSGSTTRSYPAGWADDGAIGSGLLSVGAATNEPIWVDTNGDYIYTEDEDYDNCAVWFSNYGAWVEIVAPGVAIYSTTPVSYPFWENYFSDATTPYDSWNGTSMAAPHVAGAAARTWSVYPTESNSQIHNRLMNSGWSLNIQVDPNYPIGAARPFCWPSTMTNSVYLNVAAAMDRGAISSWGTDAITGLPLTGASFQAVTTTGSVKDTAKLDTNTNRWFDLINLPTSYTYNLQVSKSGYTSGYQKFWWYFSVYPGSWTVLPGIGVPPNTNFNVVADWWGSSTTDLNLYVLLPPGSPSGMVGDGYSGHANDVGVGTLLDFPQARWNREGGTISLGDWAESESITVNRKPGMSYPYYPYAYDVYLRDWNSSEDYLEDSYPVIRIWYGGAIKAAWSISSGACDAADNWWHAGWFYKNGSTTGYYENDGYSGFGPECGLGTVYTNPDGVWYYSLGQTISTINR
jgi:subtilisin family serine protease